MKQYNAFNLFVFWGLTLSVLTGCKVFKETTKIENVCSPNTYGALSSTDTLNTGRYNWQFYFDDANLTLLVDSALAHNQELNIVLQDIIIHRNEVRQRKGEYLPFVQGGLAAGLEKTAKYTRMGAVEENLNMKDGVPFPEPLSDLELGIYASWELDIWHKLRNARKSAFLLYLGSVEGKNFLITHLVSELAESYYELMALDNILKIIEDNIVIQNNAFQILKQQKEAAKVTQLAVNRFEAQVLNTVNLQYVIRQKIVETENKINLLVGRYPQEVKRSSSGFKDINLPFMYPGIPSQLLENRPDIRKAELELIASKLDVKVAKANFYPNLSIRSGIGFQAFNPILLFHPHSLMYSFAGDLITPLVNRSAIKAIYYNANARQIQAVYNYERSILNAFMDVYTQLSKTNIYSSSFKTKSKEVDLLMKSIDISNSLFNSARADYIEVLLTQRDALDAQMELVDIKLNQLKAKVGVYIALGGGWR